MAIISNASLEDEDCSDITDWTADSGPPCETSQVTFDGKSCFKFATNAGATPNCRASIYKDVGSYVDLGNRIVVSLNLYCDAIGTFADNDLFLLQLYRDDWQFRAWFASDGLFICDGVNYNEVGMNLVVQDTWQEWTFDIDLSGGVGSATCDVYLDRDLKAADVDCSYDSGGTDGNTILRLIGYTTNDRIAYVDWFKAGNRFNRPLINIGDTWKEIEEIKINIGDVWKDVSEIKVNIGDVWKDVIL